MYTELLKQEYTFASTPEDHSWWHKNRTTYAVWALEIAEPELEKRLQSARAYMSPFLITNYQRVAHITLGQCGFISHTQNHPDDYTYDMFQTDIAQLLQWKKPNIEFKIGGILNSYPIALFFPVLDHKQHLSSLNRILSHHLEKTNTFVPHITIGLYAQAWKTFDIYQKIIGFPQDSELELASYKIKLLSFNATEIGGPLTEQASLNLQTQELFMNHNFI